MSIGTIRLLKNQFITIPDSLHFFLDDKTKGTLGKDIFDQKTLYIDTLSMTISSTNTNGKLIDIAYLKSYKNRQSLIKDFEMNFDQYPTKLMYVIDTDSSEYIIDTGSTCSLLFDISNLQYRKVGTTTINNIKEHDILEVEYIKIGEIHLYKHKFVYLPKQNTIFSNYPKAKGLIGMDIISQRNCL